MKHLIIALIAIIAANQAAAAEKPYNPKVASYCIGQVITLGQMDVRSIKKYAFEYDRNKQEKLERTYRGVCIQIAEIATAKNIPADLMIRGVNDKIQQLRESYATQALAIYNN